MSPTCAILEGMAATSAKFASQAKKGSEIEMNNRDCLQIILYKIMSSDIQEIEEINDILFSWMRGALMGEI